MIYRATCTIGSVCKCGDTITQDDAVRYFRDVARLIKMGALVVEQGEHAAVLDDFENVAAPCNFDANEVIEELEKPKKGRPAKVKK